MTRAKLSPFLLGSAAAHVAAAPALAVAPARWPWIAGALVADHLAIMTAGLLPRSGWLGPNLRRDARAAAAAAVALTLDDGPDPDVTPRVLDLLDAYRARATFFCIGERVERHADLAAEIARRGHRLENHTHTHRRGFFFHSPRRLREDLERCQGAIARVAGRAPTLFRAPAGIRGPLLEPVLAAVGLSLCSWTRRGFDTVAESGEAVARRLTRGLAAGDILLLHDGGGGAVVLDALARVLHAAREAGLSTVPVADPRERA